MSNEFLTGTVLQGVSTKWRSGFSVSGIDDINGDGQADIIIGSRQVKSGVGQTFVVFGQDGGLGAELKLAELDGENGFTIRKGGAVAGVGDVNGDGHADFAVKYGPEAVIVFGRSGAFPARLDVSNLDGAVGFGFSFQAGALTDPFSISAAGDVNGDGTDDFIVGNSGGGNGGRAYVVFGRDDGFDPVVDAADLDGSNGFVLMGTNTSNNAVFYGRSVSAAGDLNGDGIDDVIIGASTSRDGGPYPGRAAVLFGSADGFAATVLLDSLNGDDGFRIFWDRRSGDSIEVGQAVAAVGDVNGDGLDDVIVGAPGEDEVAVVFGRTDGFAAETDWSSLEGTNGVILIGDSPLADDAGTSVSGVGDVNGDGIDDFLIGAPGGQGLTHFGGRSYLVFGQAGGFPATLSLSSLDGTNGYILAGADSSELSGMAVSGAGDINGDGIDDLIVDVPSRSEGIGVYPAGETYIIHGGSDLLARLDRVSGSTDGLIQLAKVGSSIGTDGADAVTASAADDLIYGLRGADHLRGMRGDDVIIGQGGRDVLDGGAGDDVLKGGRGADIFVFVSGRDVIRDFDITRAGERIDLSRATGITDFDDLRDNHVETVNGATIITDADGDVLKIAKVGFAQLSSDDFLF